MEQAEKAHGLLWEYNNIFPLEKHDMGHSKVTKHKIVLKDPDTPPFKEWFHRIPPPQVDEVREHLKLMLDAGVVRLSKSPWCNAVVLVRKKDGSLHFYIDFRRLNALTIKDSHPLPHICETLDSLAGAAHYLTFYLNSGFWQVPMDKDSSSILPLHWAAWVCMSAKVSLSGCVMPCLLSKGSCKTVWANCTSPIASSTWMM